MNELKPARVLMDTDEYGRQVRESRRNGECFICQIVAGTHSHSHQIVYEDADTIAFLDRYPTLLGHCLVAPRQHVESWIDNLSEAQFLNFQLVAYQVARALAATVPTERMYSLSVGSQQANAHLHWHLAPLPPGVPYEEQELNALRKEDGILDISESAQANLARAIRSNLAAAD